jgi:hypothetical protein
MQKAKKERGCEKLCYIFCLEASWENRKQQNCYAFAKKQNGKTGSKKLFYSLL